MYYLICKTRVLSCSGNHYKTGKVLIASSSLILITILGNGYQKNEKIDLNLALSKDHITKKSVQEVFDTSVHTQFSNLLSSIQYSQDRKE